MIDENQIREVLYKVMKSKIVYDWDVDYDFSKSELDSLDFVTMAMLIEEKYDIKIPDEDLSELKSIKSVIGYLGPCVEN